MGKKNKRVTIKDLEQLDFNKAAFVIEYSRDYDVTRAAQAVGISYSTGCDWIKNDPCVALALNNILESRLESSHIDAEWLLYELVDNHRIARERGNISASNTALSTIAKLAAVDAFAAEKTIVASDQDVMDRLMRGRSRMRDNGGDVPLQHKPVSFINNVH